MKTIQSLVLAAIVLGTSACASTVAKQAPAAELGGGASTSATRVASPVEAPPAAVAITPLSADTNATTGTAADGAAPPINASPQTTQSSANAPDAMTQAEQEAETLYATPAVRDPFYRPEPDGIQLTRVLHGARDVLSHFPGE